MWTLTICCLLLQNPLSGPAPTAPPPDLPAPASDSEHYQTGDPAIQARAAQKTVRELVALGPRMGGTPSGDRAVEYLAKQFGDAGLKSRIIQEKEALVYWQDSWSLVAHIEGKAGKQTHTLERTWPYGFTPAGNGRFPVRLDPEEGAAVLFESFHNPPRKGPNLGLAMVDGFNTKVGDWPKLRPLRRSKRNRYPCVGISATDGAFLRQALAERKDVQLELKLDAHVEMRPTKSVEAILPARAGAPPGFFVICAHGDSDAGGPGANDNASGVAIVLELAKAWNKLIEAQPQMAPAREVRFVIWGTEITSTRQYLDHAIEQGLPILGVLNFDQAGYGAGGEQLNIEPDDLDANQDFITDVLLTLKDKGSTIPGLPKRWATNKSLGGTDSYVFSGSDLFRNAGLPSVTLFTSAWDNPANHPRSPGQLGESWQDRKLVSVDYDPFYHSAGDLPENTTDREGHNMVWCAVTGLWSVHAYLERLDQTQADPPPDPPSTPLGVPGDESDGGSDE